MVDLLFLLMYVIPAGFLFALGVKRLSNQKEITVTDVLFYLNIPFIPVINFMFTSLELFDKIEVVPPKFFDKLPRVVLWTNK